MYDNFHESKLKENPFLKELVIEVSRREDKSSYKLTADGTMLPNTFEQERQNSTKLYLSTALTEISLKLSGNGLKMLFYIITHLQPGTDYIKLHPTYYMKRNSIKSIKTYKTAVKELIKEKLIEKTGFEYVYFINPAYIFCGSRLHKFPENKVITYDQQNYTPKPKEEK